MADCCCNNMLDVVDADVHRLLPLEIIKDIGIANADELRRIAILQELSARLAAVLGDTKEGSQDHRRLYPASSWATNSYQHHHGPPQPQVYREVDSRGRIADGHAVNAQRAHALSSFWNARMVGTGIISVPRFVAPAAASLQHVDVVPPAKQAASKGTGVFLPRAQAYPDTTSGARTGGGADMKPRRRRGKEQFRQQQRQQLRLHAQAVAGAPAELQARWSSDTHAASHGWHDDELGLPQEWIYW